MEIFETLTEPFGAVLGPIGQTIVIPAVAALVVAALVRLEMRNSVHLLLAAVVRTLPLRSFRPICAAMHRAPASQHRSA